MINCPDIASAFAMILAVSVKEKNLEDISKVLFIHPIYLGN